MGYLSERLATTITASLVQWQLRENGGVQGTIERSISPEYRDGDKYLFMNAPLVHFAYAAGFWPDHFILSTQTGSHFLLLATEQVIDETSVA